MADLAALAPPSSSPYSPNPAPQNPLPSPLTTSAARQWRPAAQRNLRNQWSKLVSHRQQWASSSSAARSHATSLVNAFLCLKYMPSMELGVLSDMPDLRKKACQKLSQQQELHRRKLLASYKDMKKLQRELVQMLISELNLKRLLVVELLSVSCKVPAVNTLHWWSDELYPGEFGDLSICNLYSGETCRPVYPTLDDQQPDMPATQCNQQPDYDVLQVYLATWLAEVNASHRVDEIYAEVGKEMHVKLS
ncbi:unnamed protein product [Malus baccata var. baccata]